MGRALSWAALAIALGCGCRTTLGLGDLDRLERSVPARTIALEERFTLWSPYSADVTRDWIEVVAEELAAVEALFEHAGGARMLVKLTPVDGLAAGAAAGADSPVLHGVAGQAWEDTVNVFVAVPGPGGQDSPASHRGTLRHELAHAFSARAGIGGGDWLREGVAQFVESLELQEGELVDVGAPVMALARARRMPLERSRLARLLAWREDGERVLRGEEEVDFVSRTLCGLFVRFLLEEVPEGSFAERLDGLAARSAGDLLELETAWQAWLAGPLG